MTTTAVASRWGTIALRDCCQIVSGSTPSREVSTYWGGTIPWATPKDLSELEGPILESTPECITQKGFDSCSTQMLPKGAVLFSSRAPIGLVAIAGQPMCTNQGFKSFVPGPGIDSLYLYYALKSMVPQIQARGNGATFKEVSKEVIGSFEVPIPFPDDPRGSLAEQKRIAAILDKADAIRRRRQEAARLADTLIPSVFYEMFGDARTNRHKWPMRKFSEVCESRLGKMLNGKQQTGEHRRPYLGNANVQWFRFDLANLKDMDFDEFDRAEFRLQVGDVLICEGGEVGRAAVWRDELPECYFQKAIHRARPYAKKATPEYIAWLMRDLAQHGGFDLVTSQATIAHLTGEKLKGLPIPAPPFPLQEVFSKKVRELEAFGAVQRSACAGLDDLFNSLVQRAFRGEL